jgi:hypothetical protein
MPKGNPVLSVLHGGGGERARVELTGFRLRPGDRPHWVELSIGYEEQAEWRRLAARHGLSADVWVALQVEWTLVIDDIGAEAAADVVERAGALAAAPMLAPTAELRSWVAYLAGGGIPSDDLPSIALPERLVARLRPADLERELRGRSQTSSAVEAITVDIAAANAGMTLEAWAYREAMRY